MKPRIMVFGSVNLDITTRSRHLPVPGESLIGLNRDISLGGKGFNQAVAAHRAGADVIFTPKIGGDELTKIAEGMMAEFGLDMRVMRDPDKDIGLALVMVDDNTGQNMILVVIGAADSIRDDEVDVLEPEIKKCGCLLIQLETNLSAAYRAIDMAYRNGVRVILNPAPVQKLDPAIYKKVYMLTPNEVEAALLSGMAEITPSNAPECAAHFKNLGVESVIITLGKHGAYVSDPGFEGLIGVPDVKVAETTGAGDAFNGGLVAALSEGMDIQKAVKFANSLASIKVTRTGTSKAMPARDEIDRFFKEHY